MFQPVTNQVDFPAQERAVLDFWKRTNAFETLRQKLSTSEKRFSFIDGPITANNPMGVHHAWGRTYKDVWQRYKAMQGFNQRWQNGFDCQGLWVEVEVEKSLKLTSKRQIEEMGLDKFVALCKERVVRMAALQTDQSVRLGYWMDWNDTDELRMLADKLAENPEQRITLQRNGREVTGTAEQLIGQLGMPELEGSYFTFADENNYQIWGFLKKCFEKGWLYRGADVIPWCARCGTGISNMEMETDGYKDRVDPAMTVRMKLHESEVRRQKAEITWASEDAAHKFDETANKYILAWTTTPWTLPANVMCAVGPKLTYAVVLQMHSDGENAIYFLSKQTLKVLKGEYEVLGEILGEHMDGWTYDGLFDELPAWQAAHTEWRKKAGNMQTQFQHRIIVWKDVGEAEGTGIVHNAPGCGPEDYHLGLEHNTPMVAPLDEAGNYLAGFGELTGQHGHEVPDTVEKLLRANGNFYKREKYTHRYAHCWRCKSPLLYRLVDEWYIGMDELRHMMAKVSNEMNWVPSFGKERELDWLKNMSDWMISKKRYWGLALPIWVYADGSYEVIGSKAELKARAVEGWDEFEGHTPHRPFIDKVKIKHPVTGLIGTRIPDVGNPWLDAGVVSFSTLQYGTNKDYWRQWFPADFITECFPGQFRNWFYSLIAMSTVLEEDMPTKTVLGFATLLDEKGEAMHKSKGNSIEFSEAADKAGADVMRWLYSRQKYDDNLLFGYNNLATVRKDVLIPLWNVYSFFVTYANADQWQPVAGVTTPKLPASQQSNLDLWVLARLQETVNTVTDNLDVYEARTAVLAVEKFIEDLSAWYVRRSRERFWREGTGAGMDADKQAAYETLYNVLTTLVKLIAPFMPFLAEAMWQNLAQHAKEESSVHHQTYPAKHELSASERTLLRQVAIARTTVNLGHSVRSQSKVKVRQPLARLLVVADEDSKDIILKQTAMIADELNVKHIEFVAEERELVSYKVLPDLKKLGKKLGQDLPKIKEALGALDPMQVAAQVKRGESIAVAHVQLAPDELIVQAIPREGLVVAGDNGIVVALDTVLTEDLINEGLAREVVRRVNDLRKAAGLNISDRIYTTFAATPKLAHAIALFTEYIQGETLSLSLTAGEVGGAHTTSDSFDGETVSVAIVKG